MTGRHAWDAPVAMGIALVLLVVAVSASSRLGVTGLPYADPGAVRVTLRPLASGFDRPVFATGTADGSGDLYVAEQRGIIRRVSKAGSVDSRPTLDISDRVLAQHERGLLGFALHPRFPQDRRLFVAYSRQGSGDTVLSEFTLADGPSGGGIVPTVQEESERQLLVIPQPYSTHKAGMLAFDRDGMLLMGVGDGGNQDDPMGNGLDASTLLGKLLRLDIDSGRPYAIPPDNGFATDPAARPEIHAIGLRNPWRFSVDRVTGRLMIADVGERDWEEINVWPAGRVRVSFGWSDMEGRGCFGGHACVRLAHVRPAIAYPHAEGDTGHCGVIGGYTYRGSVAPSLRGLYLFSDFCSGTIWAVDSQRLADGTAERTVVGAVPQRYGQPHSFGEDDDGELVLVTSTGDLLRIEARALAPGAVASARGSYSAASRRSTAGRMPPLR